MSWSTMIRAFVSMFVLAFLALSRSASAASPAECEALSSLMLQDTRITSATWNPEAPTLPEHCGVQGVIGPGTIGFVVQLPTDWNGKLYHGGGGGYVGAIPDPSAGLRLHYATTATDTGHTGGGTDASWALDNPQALVDFGYRAIHVTTVTAKEIIASYYGRAAGRSYFVGCSRGGGQGLMEAQRFPDDFDGIVVGAPAFSWTGLMMNFNWADRALAAAPIPEGKLSLIASAVLANCDAKDGLVDGLIEDARRCTLDPASLQCADGDQPDCLTAGQVETVRKIYAGPSNSQGEQLSPGFAPGGEDGPGGWASWLSGGQIDPPLGFQFEDNFFRYIVFNNPAYDPFTFDFDTGPASPQMVQAGQILNATDPDLTPFQSHGGKIVMYHGWNDHALSPINTAQYYENVVRTMGRDTVNNFFRFFPVPGMHHCGGGPGLNTFDSLSALVSWAEQGIAPDRIIASGSTFPGRTRPLCPYPQEARYLGQGSTADASSFACQQVGITPLPLVDSFTGEMIDPVRWSVAIREGSAEEGGGTLTLSPNPDTGNSAIIVGTSSAYDLTGSEASVQVVQVVNPGSVNNQFSLQLDWDNLLSWSYENGFLYAAYYVAGVRTAVVTLAYSPQAHAWWRIRELNGTVYWETSFNGESWTIQGGAVTSTLFRIQALNAVLDSATFGSGSPNPGQARYANFVFQ